MSAVYRAGSPRPRVSVRTRGKRRELRIDGTFASAYGPRGESGPVWQAMASGVLTLAAQKPKVLVLGLAGGSVVRGILALRPRAEFVGVEIDPDVVAAAKRHFGLDQLPLEIVVEDALAYLAKTRRRFDLIVEDVFVGRGRALRKPAWLPEPGYSLAKGRLRPGGVIVSNALDEASSQSRALGRHFPRILTLSLAGWDNRVLIASTRELSAHALRGAMAEEASLAETLEVLAVRARPR